MADNKYRSHLWYVPLTADAGALRQLTRGTVRDTRPRVSPDGTRIAFRRRRLTGKETDPEHLHVLKVAGRGEPVRIGPGGPKTAVGEFAWSPAGDRIAFTDEAGPPRFIVGERGLPGAATDGKGAAKVSRSAARLAEATPTARRIGRIDWRWNDIGHLDRWEHLFVVAARDGAAARQLTSGDYGVGAIAWRPDGREIAFVSDRGPEADLHPKTSIWGVPAEPPRSDHYSEPREILALGGAASSPAWSPDGRWLAVSGYGDVEPIDDVSPDVFVGPADGSSAAIALAPELDRPVGAWQDTDLNGHITNSRGGPAWADERTIIALVTDRAASVPWRYPFDPQTGCPAGRPERLVDAGSACWTMAVAPATGRGPATVSVVGTLDGRAMELMTIAGTGNAATYRSHTTMGSAWQAAHAAAVMTRLSAPGRGGPIDVWLASPRDAGSAALPTIVDIHGGPLGGWSPAPSVEVSLLVDRGYRVVLPNIRGSTSYGREWIRPQLGDWGGVDADDIHAVLDHVVGLGLAKEKRLGLIGLSYGGFLVNWLVGTSDRFAAAISENGVTNQINDWANSDSGPEYSRASL
ncbi:MAG TPA: alpha/beta fold hydrolase, partial [Candidatus Acidoferrum sp.]|nr:alpha/beta fold hydrolase [Candidatus Acidoferrum sp.]